MMIQDLTDWDEKCKIELVLLYMLRNGGNQAFIFYLS